MEWITLFIKCISFSFLWIFSTLCSEGLYRSLQSPNGDQAIKLPSKDEILLVWYIVLTPQLFIQSFSIDSTAGYSSLQLDSSFRPFVNVVWDILASLVELLQPTTNQESMSAVWDPYNSFSLSFNGPSRGSRAIAREWLPCLMLRE